MRVSVLPHLFNLVSDAAENAMIARTGILYRLPLG